MTTLVLMRHGATVASKESRFAGWDDTPLSASGLADAERAAATLKAAGFGFDICFTSCLTRARQTLEPIAAALAIPENRIVADWRLNERHYGALQGETRAAMIERYGNSEVVEWRRSYDTPPPPLSTDDPRFLEQVARLPQIPLDQQPRGERLRDAVERVIPVWTERIAPALRASNCVLIVAHTSSIRALARTIEGLDDEASAAFRISTAIPRCYQLDENLAMLERFDLTTGTKSQIRHWANRVKPRWLGRF